MGNDIICGVSNALDAAFPGCEIYQNDVEQGLCEPCFFIATLQQGRTPYPNGRRSHTYPLNISYFPKDSGNNKEMMRVSETLMDALEIITLADGKKVRGTDISTQIVDDVLHCTITYTVFSVRKDETVEMGEATVHTKTT